MNPATQKKRTRLRKVSGTALKRQANARQMQAQREEPISEWEAFWLNQREKELRYVYEQAKALAHMGILLESEAGQEQIEAFLPQGKEALQSFLAEGESLEEISEQFEIPVEELNWLLDEEKWIFLRFEKPDKKARPEIIIKEALSKLDKANKELEEEQNRALGWQKEARRNQELALEAREKAKEIQAKIGQIEKEAVVFLFQRGVLPEKIASSLNLSLDAVERFVMKQPEKS